MHESQQQPRSTSSRPTEALPRFEQVLALGRKLVDELGTEPSVDTLGRWMAHYVAELIDAASNASAEERADAQRKCFNAILALWSHRAELPRGKRPFENLEPIVRAIESLDPDDDTPHFFRSVRGAIVEQNEEAQTRSLLEFVRNLDSTAKILIGHALAEAARSAVDRGKEWIALAEEAGVDPGVHAIVIRFVSNKADIEKKPDPSELERELLRERIKRLEAFTKMATLVSDDLKKRLAALPPPQE
jgi:hypothetical protein